MVDFGAKLEPDHGSDIGLRNIAMISNVSLPDTEPGLRANVYLQDDHVSHTENALDGSEGISGHVLDGNGGLLVPSLCHPHLHLDKAYLLSHPRYSHLQVEKGDFQEAMTLTGKAKSQFERADLLERGQRVIDESVSAGVTHMRAFVEVDAGVGTKCLEAGIELKQRASRDKTCFVQICAFAQLPLFSSADQDPTGDTIRTLMQQAAGNPDVDVVGSTPYVEEDRSKMERNVEWMVDLSIEHNLHLDFHLDYNLDADSMPLVWYVIRMLIEKNWKDWTARRTVVLGHCTALTLFDDEEWKHLASWIREEELPVHFVGLPTSDLFMMRTGKQPEVRGTLDIPRLIKDYNANACIGVNNIGNAFTPQGSCDPLSLACQGVGIYQAGTKRDAQLLFECVSTRARAAIGLARRHEGITSLQIHPDDQADLLLFQGSDDPNDWRTRTSVSEAVYLYDQCRGRKTIFGGKCQ